MIIKRSFILLLALTLLSSTLSLLAPSGVDALTAEQITLYRSGNYWYDAGSASTFCGAGEGTVNLSGSNNAESAFNYFRARGLTAEQSAAILGNLQDESGLDPARKQKLRGETGYLTFSDITEVANSNGTRGYGLAQWTVNKRQDAWVAYTQDKGLNIVDLGAQLEWIWQEWPSHEDYGKEEFLETEDLRQLTWIFLSYYERPGSISGYEQQLTQPPPGDAQNSLNHRYENAQEFLAQFGGNTVATVDTPSQCLTGTTNSDFAASGVRIDRSPPGIHVKSNCTRTFTDGAEVLKQFIFDTWRPPVEDIGGHVCRPINNCDADERGPDGHCTTTPTSIHGLGRALDIYVDATDPAELIIGDTIRNWLINNSDQLGVQRVIWNYYSWNSEKAGWNEYGGNNKHTDHIHAEINNDAASLVLPWYSGR